MRYVVIPLVIVFFVIAYLGHLNPGKVTIALTQDALFEPPITSLILFSAVFGATLVIIGSGIRETKNLFLTWKSNRRQKKAAKMEEYYAEAVNAYLAKRFRDAVGLFQKVLALNPNHVNALLSLGKIYRREQNYTEAVRLHRKARGLDEQNVEVLLSLARDLEEAQRFEEAAQYLREVLRVDESNLTALTRLRNLHVNTSSWEEAHQSQERLLKLATTDEERLQETKHLLGMKYELGLSNMKHGNKEVARRYFKGAIKLSKAFLPAYIGLGETHLREGKGEHAANLWEKAYNITRNVILLHKLEDLYLELGNPEKIIQVYQRALEEDPQNLILRFYLGKLYYRLEMVDHAFETLVEIDSHVDYFPDLHKILGNLYQRQGDLERAVESFKKGLRFKKRVLVPYYCPRCDNHTMEWSGRCSRCGRWNSYKAEPIIGHRRDRQTLSTTSSLYLLPSEGNHMDHIEPVEVLESAPDQHQEPTR